MNILRKELSWTGKTEKSKFTGFVEPKVAKSLTNKIYVGFTGIHVFNIVILVFLGKSENLTQDTGNNLEDGLLEHDGRRHQAVLQDTWQLSEAMASFGKASWVFTTNCARWGASKPLGSRLYQTTAKGTCRSKVCTL